MAMIFKIFFTVSVLVASQAQALTKRELWASIIPNSVTLSYQGQVIPDKRRVSERVNHTTPEGQARIKALKSQRFICLRSSQIESLCTLTESITQLPAEVKKFVDEKMMGFAIRFYELTSEPVLQIDTSTSKEWIVNHSIQMGSKVTAKYQLTYLYEQKNYFISLSVDSGQPVSLMKIHDNQHISIQMVTNSVINKQNVGYIFSIILGNEYHGKQ